MIYLKKLNGTDFVLNCELIETVEAKPDTTLTLINGKKILINNTVEEVVNLVLEYKRKTLIKELNV